MIKNFAYILLSAFLINQIFSKQIHSSCKEDVMVNSFNLYDGAWYYLPYVDSSVKQKKIYNILFNNDNFVALYGYRITFDKDTPDIIEVRGVYNGINKYRIKKIDSNKYSVDSDWLKYLTINNDKQVYHLRAELSDSILIYGNYTRKYFDFYQKKDVFDAEGDFFCKNIFEGDYLNITNNQRITFKEHSIIGFKNYTHYDIPTDFIDSYSFDNITFFEINSDKYVTFNWVFKQDTLLLNAINVEYVENQDYPTKIEIGNNVLKLVKIK